MAKEHPLAERRILGQPTPALYPEFLVEEGGLFRQARVWELDGVKARVESVGKGVLVISTPGRAITREAKSSCTVHALVDFGAKVNAVTP